MSDPLVWLPFDPAELGSVPPGLRFEVFDCRYFGADAVEVPASVDEVAFYVPPYLLGSRIFDVVEQMSSLQVVQLLTAGVDAARGRIPEGVTLCNGRGIHDTSTAELTLTLILSSLRGIPDHVRHQDKHTWKQAWFPALADKRVLIVGHGAIGRAIEQRLIPFETEVIGVARTAREGVRGFDELPALVPEADVVVLATPLTDETRGLVDREFLARMKDGALLVNIARGGVVDTDALVAELATERISAALDVVEPEPLPAEHPLWDAPNLLITPHVGGPSSATWPRAHRIVREQLERFAAGEPLANVMSGDY
ncbi:phosphoglycerate dehydrogenase-like enzyme [Nocardioides albertanoniae]|uniref:Phosphoglycerate dehydrogenase-like enzyme n=1 Tax=Nocardioides albertanoniae TaxID=1175486 RepID=A0A543A5A6_9ACTN|nr:2-hydroxyacid dehydrogenase [Nocardioides albertanoniae]TQL67775.1 phosphoglycerate dehydrogenase-like enzyme [Nocardioides albertanoniae]